MKIMLAVVLTFVYTSLMAQQTKPFRIGIDGLTHTHVHWLLNRAKDGDIEIVGIAEKNRDLAERYLKQYNLPFSLLYPSLSEMLRQTKPEGVAAFNSIYDHLSTVQACAPQGIPVMVEKPLAVSLDHARQMQTLAKKHNIQLLTNYETTWYGSHYRAKEVLDTIGSIRKVVVHDGHQGPKEIGVNKEFLDWLTDPVLNGAGALTDFGCYGANLATWLMKGQRPLSVVAVTQQFKPRIYPKVDDEATIVLTYPSAQAIIQASWNWPYSRKDIEIYGQKGAVWADKESLKVRYASNEKEHTAKVPARSKPFHDPFAYFAAVVRGEVLVADTDLSSLPNNLLVVEILEAAKTSAKEGRKILMQ